MAAEPEIHKSETAFYWWHFLRVFGKECWKTWRQEMLASVLTLGAVFLVGEIRRSSEALASLRNSLVAAAIVLFCFALWHLVRTPLLVHRSTRSGNGEEVSPIYGWIGVGVILAMVAGGGYLGAIVLTHWNSSRNNSIVQMQPTSISPPAPVQQPTNSPPTRSEVQPRPMRPKPKRQTTSQVSPPLSSSSSSQTQPQPKQQKCAPGSICNQDSPNNGTQQVFNGDAPVAVTASSQVQEPTGNIRLPYATSFTISTNVAAEIGDLRLTCSGPALSIAMDRISLYEFILGRNGPDQNDPNTVVYQVKPEILEANRPIKIIVYSENPVSIVSGKAGAYPIKFTQQ